MTVTGQSKWNQATINSSLRNEIRQDDTNLENIHTRLPNQEAVKNTGQVPSYFVEQSHPAIIAPETFEMVQAEVARRKREGGRYSGVSIFSGKILQSEPKTLYVCNTLQFNDYDKYESSIFDPQEKAAYREEMFPKQCAAAYELGKSLL